MAHPLRSTDVDVALAIWHGMLAHLKKGEASLSLLQKSETHLLTKIC